MHAGPAGVASGGTAAAAAAVAAWPDAGSVTQQGGDQLAQL